MVSLLMVTGTQTSKIYKVEREGAESSLILKLLSEEGIRDEAPGAIALKTFGGSGAVELIESDQGAHLLEYADGRSLLDLVDGGEDERALSIIIDTIEKLHGRRSDTNPGGLVSLERRFRALFKKIFYCFPHSYIDIRIGIKTINYYYAYLVEA